jgi:hypothetical protein
MAVLYYLLLLPTCSVVMGLLGFWIGRCARKLPILDDKLPWTLHRNQIPTTAPNTAEPGSGTSRWP